MIRCGLHIFENPYFNPDKAPEAETIYEGTALCRVCLTREWRKKHWRYPAKTTCSA